MIAAELRSTGAGGNQHFGLRPAAAAQFARQFERDGGAHRMTEEGERAIEIRPDRVGQRGD